MMRAGWQRVRRGFGEGYSDLLHCDWNMRGVWRGTSGADVRRHAAIMMAGQCGEVCRLVACTGTEILIAMTRVGMIAACFLKTFSPLFE